jgi:mRNA-degrading endonuclease RelE of RelBE toxin-antitoxin system
MSYRVKFSSQARKFFCKLPTDVQKRVKAKFREISKSPFRYLEHYEGDYDKIRIGKLRALVDIDNERKIISVRVFDKRGRIYK